MSKVEQAEWIEVNKRNELYKTNEISLISAQRTERAE